MAEIVVWVILTWIDSSKEKTSPQIQISYQLPRKGLSWWFANEKLVHNLSGFVDTVSISVLVLAPREIKNFYSTYKKIQYSYVPVY